MTGKKVEDLLLRPAGVIALGAVVGLIGWGVGGLVIGAVAGIALSFLVGIVVNWWQGGPVPRKHRHELVRKVLTQDRDTIGPAYPNLDESDWFEAVEEDLNAIIERAASQAPSPGSVWNAENMLRAATNLAFEQETEERKELYRVLGGHIQSEWYLKEYREERDAELQARKTRIGNFVYEPLESSTGEATAHTLGTATEDLKKEQGVIIRQGAELELVCGPKAPPHGEINLLTGSELTDDGEVRVEWWFDNGVRHEALWKVDSSAGATLQAAGYLTLDESESVRGFVADAAEAEQVTLSFKEADGASVRYSFGLDGLSEGLEYMPCFQN